MHFDKEELEISSHLKPSVRSSRHRNMPCTTQDLLNGVSKAYHILRRCSCEASPTAEAPHKVSFRPASHLTFVYSFVLILHPNRLKSPSKMPTSWLKILFVFGISQWSGALRTSVPSTPSYPSPAKSCQSLFHLTSHHKWCCWVHNNL